MKKKSRMIAGMLGIFLGWLGVHNFYLGFNRKGCIQAAIGGGGLLLYWIIAPLTGNIVWIIEFLLSSAGLLAFSAITLWGMIEGIMIISKNRGNDIDSKGNPLS
jgi:TM2 domain-containing membrane protein YozV